MKYLNPWMKKRNYTDGFMKEYEFINFHEYEGQYVRRKEKDFLYKCHLPIIHILTGYMMGWKN